MNRATRARDIRAAAIGVLAAVALLAPATGPIRAQTPPADSPPMEAAPPSPQPEQQGPPLNGAGAEPGTETAAPAAPAKPKKKTKPKPPPRETALSEDPTPLLQPETFYATSQASERYAAIADAGGWPKVGVDLKPGAKGAAVRALRRRLAAEGDLSPAAANGAVWDAALTAAVKRFQFRMGLRQTGIVSGATLRELDVPAAVRFRQLASSAQRLAGEFLFDHRYVVVNIPAASVDAVENGKLARRYVAIVGDVDHPSPEVDVKIVAINFNPIWTLPASIIKNEVVPRMRRDPGYLARAHIRVFDARGHEINPRKVKWSSERAAQFTLRQDSGAHNSLGSIRISMPNKLAVYMHDTPAKALFANDYRFLSHGCVRVEGVYDLAAWLLEGSRGSPTGTWDTAAIQRKIATHERAEVRLAHPVPVIWIYMTGWASADGTVHFRDDVYDIDTVGEAQGDQ